MNDAPPSARRNPRQRVRAVVESRWFQRTILVLIIVNAVVLGLETFPAVMWVAGGLLVALNWVVLAVFTVEIALRLYVGRWRFFTDGWNVFDFLVVVLSYLPIIPGLQVVRVLRVLRVLRLLSQVRSMRRIVGALLAAIPGIASIGGLLIVIGYVFVVVATTLYGDEQPEYFGDLGASAISLFRLLVGDGWGTFVQPLSETNASAWPFFVLYTVVSTFIILNLFIAVTTEALNNQRDEVDEQLADAVEVDVQATAAAHTDMLIGHHRELLAELRLLRAEVAELRDARSGLEALSDADDAEMARLAAGESEPVPDARGVR